jgi:uncharacterized membrane protein
MKIRFIPNDVKITMLLLILGCAGVGLDIPVLAAPVILLLPGYSLTTALFPGEDDVDEIERLLLIFGMNISIVPSVALAVNAFGFSLFGPEAPLFTAISAATIVSTLISVIRRERLDQSVWDLKLPDADIIWIVPAILILLGLLAISSVEEDGATEFYILDKNGEIHNYYWHEAASAEANVFTTPSAAQFNGTPIYTTFVDVLVVVSNHRGEGQFTVEIGSDGEILEEHHFNLRGEERWTQRFKYDDTAAQSGKPDRVIGFVLYRDQKPIRTLHLLIRNDIIKGEA